MPTPSDQSSIDQPAIDPSPAEPLPPPRLPPLALAPGIRQRWVESVNGLDLHLLEAGNAEDPCILLLHGFPDLAYGWRNVLLLLAAEGYYVLAPDLRGYGRTTGWPADYHCNLRPFSYLNLVKDVVALLNQLGRARVHGLVGHDFGSPLAAYTSLVRPDLIERTVLMSAPFAGAPSLTPPTDTMDAQLAALTPARRHYQSYYATAQANADMLHCPQGLSQFLRAYFHMKSADWPANQPTALGGWTADELAKLPEYYVMQAARTMPETVANALPAQEPPWLTAQELAVYAAEYQRTGFQGGLNWYRCNNNAGFRAELAMYYRCPLAQPCWFISGAADWGNHQTPGALKRQQTTVCNDFRGVHLIEGAGHWVQQEQPEATVELLLQAFSATL